MAPGLFQAVANALDWWEVTCRRFGTARHLHDDAVLDVIAPEADVIASASGGSADGSQRNKLACNFHADENDTHAGDQIDVGWQQNLRSRTS